jgi:hypothetical protein
MTPADAHRAALALADLGHVPTNAIPCADIDMAAALAGVPTPQSTRDRVQICGALDAIAIDHGRHSA